MANETLAARLVSTEVSSLVIGDSFPVLAGGSTAGMAKFDVLRDLIDTEFTRAAAIMSVSNASTAEGTVDATPRVVTAWTTDGLENNMTVDSTTGNDITADIGGTYVIMCSISFSGTASKTFVFEIRKNGASTGFQGRRKLGAGGDVGDVTISGLLALSATDTVEIYQSTIDGGSAIIVTDGQLVVNRAGP